MTFEEFKRDAEKFSPIDTPQKFEWCKRAYETAQLQKEDSNFLEPLEQVNDRLSSIYNKNLYSIFGFDRISEKQVLFLIQPSFEPESALVIEQQTQAYSVTLTRLNTSYWQQFYEDNSIMNCEKSATINYLEKSIGNQLFELLEQEMLKARKPRAAVMALDGVKYTISKVVAGQTLNVFKHSPDPESRTGKIIQLIEKISLLSKQDAVEEKEIRQLLRDFTEQA